MKPCRKIQTQPRGLTHPPQATSHPEQLSKEPLGDAPLLASPSPQGSSYPDPPTHPAGPWHCPHQADSVPVALTVGAPAGSDFLSPQHRVWPRDEKTQNRTCCAEAGGSHTFPISHLPAQSPRGSARVKPRPCYQVTRQTACCHHLQPWDLLVGSAGGGHADTTMWEGWGSPRYRLAEGASKTAWEVCPHTETVGSASKGGPTS